MVAITAPGIPVWSWTPNSGRVHAGPGLAGVRCKAFSVGQGQVQALLSLHLHYLDQLPSPHSLSLHFCKMGLMKPALLVIE